MDPRLKPYHARSGFLAPWQVEHLARWRALQSLREVKMVELRAWARQSMRDIEEALWKAPKAESEPSGVDFLGNWEQE